MKRISLPLCLQALALALPLGFLVAGGCGGGNGITVPPPIVLGEPTPIGGFVTPTPTAIPGTTPVPTATVDPSVTPTPTLPGTTPAPTATTIPGATPTATSQGFIATPNLVFSSLFVTSNAISIGMANETIDRQVRVYPLQFNAPRVNGLVVVGRAFEARGGSFVPQDSLTTFAGVTYRSTGADLDVISGILFPAFYSAQGGTVTVTRFVPGMIGSGGHLEMRLSNVLMVEGSPNTGVRRSFIINETFTARSGRLDVIDTEGRTPTPAP